MKLHHAITAAAAISSSTTALAGSFSFTPIPQMPTGQIVSNLDAMSGDGKVVAGVGYYDTGFSYSRAWKWTAASGFTILPVVAGQAYTRARALSFDGSTIGGGSASLPTLWTNGALGMLTSNNLPAEVQWLSEDGSVAVATSNSDYLYWGPDRVMHKLPVLQDSLVASLSRDGRVLVGRRAVNNGTGFASFIPCYWKDWVQHDMPKPFSRSLSRAMCCSSDGSVIYGYAEGPLTAFRYANGVYEDLKLSFKPWQCSADGSIVIGLADTETNDQAVLWSRATGLVPIADLLTAHGVNVTGWQLLTAFVSSSGNTLAGQGRNTLGLGPFWTATIDLTPFAVSDSFTADFEAVLTGNVLANDANKYRPVATLVTPPAHGSSFVLNTNGTFSFDPGSFSGEEKFTYRFTSEGKSSNIATVYLYCHPIKTFTVTPATATGGKICQGSVTLGYPAPTGGMPVSIYTTSNAVATVPTSIAILAGKTLGVFNVTTKPVAAVSHATVSVKVRNLTKSVALTVVPAEILSFTLVNRILPSGGRLLMRVALSGPAPSAGASVALTSSSTLMPVQSSAVLPAGTSSLYVPVKCPTVSKSLSLVFTATYRGATKSASFTVVPASLVSIGTDTAIKSGGSVVKVTVKLDGTAPLSGALVTLTSSDIAILPLPMSTTVASGATYKTFAVTLGKPSGTKMITVAATYRGVTQSVVLQVQP